MQIDRALGNAGAARDIVKPRRRETADGEFLDSGSKNGVAARGAAVSRALARPANADEGRGRFFRALAADRAMTLLLNKTD